VTLGPVGKSKGNQKEAQELVKASTIEKTFVRSEKRTKGVNEAGGKLRAPH